LKVLQKKYETMKRSALQINVIEVTRSFKMTAYSQYKVDKDYKCYPLYYQLSAELWRKNEKFFIYL